MGSNLLFFELFVGVSVDIGRHKQRSGQLSRGTPAGLLVQLDFSLAGLASKTWSFKDKDEVMRTHALIALLGSVAVAALSGCENYVKHDEYDPAIAELRQNQTAMRGDIDSTRSDLASLKNDLAAKFQKYDSQVSQLQGRVSVDMTAHFDYDKADLKAGDQQALDDFATVIREHHPAAVITVEGFTDAAGTAAYNQHLGLERAKAVRDYLVQHGNLDASMLRTVSYGKAKNRQVAPGAWGDQGGPNRRVALVIESAGAPANPPANTAS